MKKILLISGMFAARMSPSHDTTETRIGWRVTPAVDLGGDDRGWGSRAQSSGCVIF
jgi:hypothetical protein